MEHDIPFGNSNRENGTTFLDFPLFLGIFQWDEPTKRVPFTAETEIPEILTKWKAPSKNPQVRTEISQVNLTRLRIDFRKQEPVPYLRLNRFLSRRGLTGKFSPIRFIKNRFLPAGFYCIVCTEVRGHGLLLKT